MQGEGTRYKLLLQVLDVGLRTEVVVTKLVEKEEDEEMSDKEEWEEEKILETATQDPIHPSDDGQWAMMLERARRQNLMRCYVCWICEQYLNSSSQVFWEEPHPSQGPVHPDQQAGGGHGAM